MKNSVVASVMFDFKGQRYAPELALDLDSHMSASGCLPDLYPLLARACNLGMYSYEYEMLQSETIVYSQAKGLVCNHIIDGQLDLAGFESSWLEQDALDKLAVIAKQLLNIDELSKQPKIKEALLAAFQLGKAENPKEDLFQPDSYL